MSEEGGVRNKAELCFRNLDFGGVLFARRAVLLHVFRHFPTDLAFCTNLSRCMMKRRNKNPPLVRE